MTSQKTVFLVGPGFIGSTLLVHLKEKRPDLHLTALTRRDEQAQELKQLGVEPVRGSLDDVDIIKNNAAKADIIFHTATADHPISALAIVDGIKSRSDVKTRKVIYIHTSGNDELVHSAKGLAGESTEKRTLSDAKGDQVLENGRILPNSYHRQVDGPLRDSLFNEQAEKEYNVSTTIMMPPLIYGVSPEPWKRISIQTPMLTQAMLKAGLVTLPDDFKGSWNNVSVHDLSQAYTTLLAQLEAHVPGTPTPSHYCFPAEAQPFLWKELFDAVGSEIRRLNPAAPSNVKVIESPEVFQHFLGGEKNPYAPIFAEIVFGNDNSYTHPDRLNSLGFTHHGKGVVDSVRNGKEVEKLIRDELLKQQK